jgi:hypothetical protein
MRWLVRGVIMRGFGIQRKFFPNKWGTQESWNKPLFTRFFQLS